MMPKSRFNPANSWVVGYHAHYFDKMAGIISRFTNCVLPEKMVYLYMSHKQLFIFMNTLKETGGVPMAEMGQYVLVDIGVLPEVFEKVLHAKLLLAKGMAKSSADACRMADVSRGAFYKYKDSVFLQDTEQEHKTQTLYLRLSDEPGVLSSVLSALYENRANILTVNQNIPVDMVAAVTISFRTGRDMAEAAFLKELTSLNGVIEAKLI